MFVAKIVFFCGIIVVFVFELFVVSVVFQKLVCFKEVFQYDLTAGYWGDFEGARDHFNTSLKWNLWWGAAQWT